MGAESLLRGSSDRGRELAVGATSRPPACASRSAAAYSPRRLNTGRFEPVLLTSPAPPQGIAQRVDQVVIAGFQVGCPLLTTNAPQRDRG